MGVVFYPIAASLLRSFQLEEGGWGLDNYVYFFTDKIQRNNIIYTLQVVIITVVLAIGISYFLAIYLRFSNTWVSRMIGRLYLLPRFIPGLVAVNGMITVIRDSGLINRISRLLGMNLQLGLMYNGKGIVLMNLWFNIPFATMLMAAALSKIPNSTIEAARDAGADRFRILKQMILPLTYRDIFVAATFVFMSNISSFTTPYLMDGNNPQMMGISLYTQFNNGHYEKAAALSVIMFLFSVLSAIVYVYTNYVNEILAKEAQIKALESQINPHFLYNTLESINWRAKAVNNREISLMTESLGSLLRATLSNKKSLVTLSYELNLILSYITIQQIRFEERLDYREQVPDGLKNALIPPLTLQPLVENAIHYALEEMTETCYITILAAETDKTGKNGERCIRISVTNSGSSFDEDLLELLKQHKKQPSRSGIGLLNIDKRIKLLFGEDYGLSLFNQEDCAVASITIPYRTEETVSC